jgi:large subunit ribosomal protein L22e
MVAVRAKVGSRGFIRTKALAKGKKNFKIDCTIPAADGIFSPEVLSSFEQYFQENTKLHGRKGKLADKVKIALNENVLSISTTMAYRKKYFKYLTKKFLKKKDLRDWIRILSKGKETYTLKYFNIHDQEDQE